MASDDLRVLVVGYRRGLTAALRAMGISYRLWRNEDDHDVPSSQLPWMGGERQIRRAAARLVHEGPFTHVIAGTEAAVVPASFARRVLGARISKHSTVRRCHDKLVMKERLRQAGIPMTDFVDGNHAPAGAELLHRFGTPVVVKPRTSSGGKDIRFVDSASALDQMDLRNRIVERFIDAPEMSVESFVDNGEVRFESTTEYYRKKHVNVVPAYLDDETLEQALEVSRRVIRALRIHWGMTHIEMYLTPQGVKFGEIALRPPGGHIMALIDLAWNLDAWRAFVAVELGLPTVFPSASQAMAAAVIFHPGEGVVEGVAGWSEVQADPRVQQARLTVAAGDVVPVRDNVGKEVGHVLLRASARVELLEGIDNVERLLRVDLRPRNGDGSPTAANLDTAAGLEQSPHSLTKR